MLLVNQGRLLKLMLSKHNKLNNNNHRRYPWSVASINEYFW